MSDAAEIQKTLDKLGATLIGLILEQQTNPTSYIVAWTRLEEHNGAPVQRVYGTHRAWENNGVGRPFELESGHYMIVDRDAAIYDMLNRAGYHTPAEDL